jgi:hypothetical protein
MTAIFAATIFLSSALLFWLEPLFGKMVLPLMGGAPPVWNACILFYQVALLAGYAWAHAGGRLGDRRHIAIHLALSIAALAVLPFGVPGALMPPSVGHPLAWTLGVVTLGVGLPFVLIAANGPLLQRAFSRTGSRASHDPYFLYAASNLGSAISLLAYPVYFERALTLSAQVVAWRNTYVALLIALAICAALIWRFSPKSLAPEPGVAGDDSAAVDWRRRLRWMALAAIPSSLMLGVTTYISSEVAPVPLIWILPLALFLATLVVAFAVTDSLSRALRIVFAGVISPRTMRGAVVVLLATAGIGLWLYTQVGPRPTVIVAHLALFTLSALICHVRLAADRPHTSRITDYYLWLAIGGGVGGLFNTLIGPAVFTSVLEYPLMLAAVIMVLPARTGTRITKGDVLWPIGVGLFAMGIPVLLRATGIDLGFSPRLLLAIPALGALAFSGRPIRFGGALVAVIAASAVYPSEIGSIEYATRNFFSVHRVLRDDRDGFRWLTNGVTVHGGQRLSDSVTPYPLTYYSPAGPAGDVFRLLSRPRQDVGVIGLGAGALMYYGVTGQRWTFFEIDPAVTAIASNPRYFTFLSQAKAPYRIVEGDARLSLERDTSRFDILVLDAFASDAVPVHLFTREALRLYETRLRDGGIILMHISNRFYDLGPLVGAMARDAGVVAFERHDTDPDDAEITGKFGSHWVVLARHAADLTPLLHQPGWEAVEPGPMRVWTDDYSSVLPLLRRSAEP